VRSCEARDGLPAPEKRPSVHPPSRPRHKVDLGARFISEGLTVSDVSGHSYDGVPGRLDWLAVDQIWKRAVPNAAAECALSSKQNSFGGFVERDGRLSAQSASWNDRPLTTGIWKVSK
jgi:hypothetical protein